MIEQGPLTRANLKTPKAAAIAGIIFSVLLILVVWLLRISVPDDPQESGSWLKSESGTVALAVNLVPFAGIAFLWFIGVLRARLGEREDKFFATVFLGSGLLFLAMLFTAAALAGALIMSFDADLDHDAEDYILGSAEEASRQHPLALVIHLPADQLPARGLPDLRGAIHNLFRISPGSREPPPTAAVPRRPYRATYRPELLVLLRAVAGTSFFLRQ